MQKKKVLILLGGLLVLVASFSLFAWVGAASKQVTFDVSTPIALNMKGNYNAQKIPPGFDKKKNVETGKGIGSRKNSGAAAEFHFTVADGNHINAAPQARVQYGLYTS
ncbi:hypothetical protein P4H39_30435 [Paenibacillus lautus]|uniref:hypothetical protein n=1 Tax=Paenibacillus lautus TaxID=1401 RepID=UPI002DBAF030|nr:hypothetical protein [Paenibacillus lautus]MEC0206935.1 hypothetical protein [Paenibacillus lautus]